MKRILCLLICLIVISPADAKQAKLSNNNIIQGEVIELELPQEDTLLNELELQSNDKKENKKIIPVEISKYYTLDKGLLKIHINDYLNFDFGAIGNVDWTIDKSNDELHTRFKFPSTDFILSGKANDYIDYKAQMFAERNIDKETILGDLWVRGKYKNYSLQLGRFRRIMGYEPTFALYDATFASKSQIARLYGDNRDTGAKVVAQYKYADVALGLFASMQNRPFLFDEHGIEFDGWLTLKPLANYPEKGDLKIAGGFATGKRDYSYNNFGGFISYDYKKFGIKSEYISKQASFYEDKNANGFYVDLTYFLTNKLQATLRFDSYNPDVNAGKRRTNEYVAGLNYYLHNRNIMFVANYVFSDGIKQSHRIALQMRYKTW